MNLNEWAKDITRQEGKKLNLSIGQVKEVLRIVLTDMSEMSIHEVAELMRKFKKRG